MAMTTSTFRFNLGHVLRECLRALSEMLWHTRFASINIVEALFLVTGNDLPCPSEFISARSKGNEL